MQLKGLVKFFTAALIIISLYQLSFTFLVRNVEKKARAQAAREAQLSNPGVSGIELDKLTDARYDAITDSLQGEKVVNMLFKKYTFQEAKENELNLGLDLQGGMNVTLDVSLDDLVRSMSNNPKDAALNAAITAADKRRANSQADFVTLFGEEFDKANPGTKMAYLFTKPGQEGLTINSTNEQVIAEIRRQAKGAINRTYKVLQTRIDKFGVTQPTINLDEAKGIITVELAGVRNPERVRDYLQATARLQFWEIASDAGFAKALEDADRALAAQLSGTTIDTAAATTVDTATVASNDSTKTAADTTASLSALVNKNDAKTSSTDTGFAANAKEHPLLILLSAQPTRETYDPAAAGYVEARNVNKLIDLLNSDIVKDRLPGSAKILLGAQKQGDGSAVIPAYVVKVPTTSAMGEAELEGDRIVASSADYDNGKPVVNMTMDLEGSRIWKAMTGRLAGRYVAVSLDDRIYSAPRVNGEIDGGRTQISGSFTIQEAQDLANILESGKLEAPARIVQEQVVGPTLGAENIEAGIKSLAIAFAVIFVLMLIYYNTGGIVANIALILNVFFTIAILSMLHATLTMPGIAGLVLTIGMAVDTNVIVFERIKEELSAGMSYSEAVKRGYTRSYAPVLDGHITQFLTALILFLFGLGPVKGFATTQMLGLFLSVFCGLLVSRLITDMYTKRERHFKYFTTLSKSIFRKAHFRFIEIRKVTYIISIIVFLAGVSSFFVGFDYGVEFAGGRSYTIRFDKAHEVTEVREKLASHLGGERPIVKTIGNDNELNITTTYLIEQSGQEVTNKVAETLREGLLAENLLPAGTDRETFDRKYVVNQQTVLPTISDDLKKGAIQATVISLIAIFLYILLRFRKWQYSLGTIIALLHDVCITLAVFAFLKGRVPFALEIDQHFIAAILTVIGFSMNDTVIVFDRVREYFRKSPNEDKKSIINRAINDTLSRTIMTSLTVFLTVLILFIFGGEVTRGFAFAMLIGVITGTYSSIFVAAPILVDMDRGDSLKNEVDREARVEELKKLA